MKRSASALILALLLSGCGGSGTQPAPVTSTSSGQNADAFVVATLDVPGATSAQSGSRTPQYISASSLGLKVTVTDVPPAGGTASFLPIVTTYTLATGFNTIVVPTPTSASGHSEDLTYVTYNAAPVSNAIPTGAKALGYGITTGFVVKPGQNTNNVVLSGVVDSFAAPIAETGAFATTSASGTPAGAQTSLGLGGNAMPTGVATVYDAGGNDITTAAGAPWPVVGAVPATATTVGTGVPLTIAETAGTCGAVGTGPHLKLAVNGGTPATTAAIASTSDSVAAIYDGNGGAGWYATVSAKGQSQTLTDTLSSLAVTSTSNDFNCTSQALSFSASSEKVLMTVVEHNLAKPYTVTVPNTPNCNDLVTVFVGGTSTQIMPGTPTSLGTGITFTIQLIAAPATANTCEIAVSDANAGVTGGAAYPGGTTYVGAILPAGSSLIVP